MRNNKLKWFIVVFVTAWAIYSFYPPQKKDLIVEFTESATSKDTNFNAIVEQARKLATGNQYQDLRVAVGTNDLSKYFPSIKPVQGMDYNRLVLNRLQREAAGKVKLGLDLQGGTSFLVGVDTTKATGTNAVNAGDKQAILEQAIEVLRKRVDKFGVAEPILQPQGENRILIQLPGLAEADIDAARRTIEQAAFLEFRLVHPESDQLIQQGLGAPGYEKLFEKRKDKQGHETLIPMLVKRGSEKGLTGKYVKRASVYRDPMSNEPQITMTFDNAGSEMFADITRAATGRRLAIVLDNVLYSAPVIEEPITGGSARIRGSFDIKEAFTLANVLENPLEAPVKVEEQRGVGPSLGADSIRSGVRSSIIGVVAVAVFMLVYYMIAGAIANVALLVNLIILLGVLCSIGTTLTLPGIAGIVLTAGMAVDANVLIYERLREELAAGKSMRGAISVGYSKAFSTIFDSHVTTLISSVILIINGTGPVKGFGVSLTIGVAASLFTALVVTRLIFDFMLDRGWLKSLPMLHLVKGAHLDFMKLAKPAFILSWMIIIVGLVYGVKRGHGVMGVDFAGGDSLTLTYEKSIDDNKARESLQKAGIKEASYQEISLQQGKGIFVTVPYKEGPVALKALQTSFPEAKLKVIGTDQVGPTIGAEILQSALISSLLAMFGILCYVAMRYEFSFAVGAIVAIIHDILMTMGCFFLSGRELNAPIVAAILTIIGFSINDTIVIFDRIREDLKLGIRGTFREIMNKALNQTLSRTLITSGTVFIATLSLYLFGGGMINDFAFTFLVGILTGTYSSIYIASALVLWWHKGQRPEIGGSRVAVDNSVEARV